MNAPPVTDDHAREAPLPTQHRREQMLVLRAPSPVHLIICCHQSPGIALAHSHLEWTQVDLVHGTVSDAHIHRAASILLVVQGIMLQTYRSSIVLCTLRISHGEHTTEQRVLTQILISASSRRNALDIDGWPQDHVFTTHSGLPAHTLSIGISPFGTPGGSQCRARREEGGRVGRQMGRVP